MRGRSLHSGFGAQRSCPALAAEGRRSVRRAGRAAWRRARRRAARRATRHWTARSRRPARRTRPARPTRRTAAAAAASGAAAARPPAGPAPAWAPRCARRVACLCMGWAGQSGGAGLRECAWSEQPLRGMPGERGEQARAPASRGAYAARISRRGAAGRVRSGEPAVLVLALARGAARTAARAAAPLNLVPLLCRAFGEARGWGEGCCPFIHRGSLVSDTASGQGCSQTAPGARAELQRGVALGRGLLWHRR